MRGRKPQSGVRINEGIGARSDHPEVVLTRTPISGSAATAYRKVFTCLAKILVGQVSKWSLN